MRKKGRPKVGGIGKAALCTMYRRKVCYMLYVICYMLYVICYMLYVICYKYVICYRGTVYRNIGDAGRYRGMRYFWQCAHSATRVWTRAKDMP